MTTAATSPYTELHNKMRDIETLTATERIISWDQETMMPTNGAELRADQLTQLSGMIHAKKTDPAIGELLQAAAADSQADEIQAANIREMQRDFDRDTKLPTTLVEALARASSLGMHAWKEARAKEDFSIFAPKLKEIFDLNREKADCLGVPEGGERYDALMDLYEPGMTAARTEEVFKPLRTFTVDTLASLRDKTDNFTNTPDLSPATLNLPLAQQKQFVKKVLEQMCYSDDEGREDDAAHPFCTGIGPGDTRITNRYRADGWCDSLSSGMHEGGHALYEMGIDKRTYFGLPMGSAVSLGIHESQSRMWENQIGRSLPFWNWALPIAREIFGEAIPASINPTAMFKASNLMHPSFIRVESDELTYNLHIMLRFDFERALIKEDLSINDLPAAWNERMKQDFGLDVPNDSKGCLQDIHWSMAAVGYFATYSFGNIYSAQFWNTIGSAFPDRDAMVERGELEPIRNWLRDNIHAHGRRYSADDLCAKVTGEGMNAEPLMAYLKDKVERVYG